MIRVLLIVFIATACAVFAYGDPAKITTARTSVTEMIQHRTAAHARIQQIPRGNGGEFKLDAKINGVKVPMVIDTGATSVVRRAFTTLLQQSVRMTTSPALRDSRAARNSDRNSLPLLRARKCLSSGVRPPWPP